MIRASAFCVLLVSLSGAALPALGQEATELQLGSTLEGELSAGERDTFLIDVDVNQTVFAEVDQKDLDVVARVYGPDGRQVAEFNRAPILWEWVQFEAAEAGEYRIELMPASGDSGRYTIRLDLIEPQATTPEGRISQWVAFFDRAYRRDRPGGAIAIVRNGEVTYAGAFGLANLTYGIPFTTETPSNIGSLSKSFTAFAISLLEKEGRLSFEDDVRTYLPELPEFGRPVTILNLLNHTGGFREIYATLAMQGKVPGRWTRGQLIQIVQRQRELQYPPGSRMSYSNTGFVLLAEVVERVTGVPFGDWMEENVFRPLGMEHTTAKTHGGQIIPNSAMGYRGIRGGEGQVWEEGIGELDAFYGASGIYSTVGDLTKWVRNFSDPRIGGPALMSRMAQPGVLTNGDTLDWGFGFFIDNHRGLRRYSYLCEDGDRFSHYQYFPEIDVGVVWVAISRLHMVTLRSVAEGLFGEEMVPEGVPEPQPRESQEQEPIEIDRALLDAYAGHFRSDELGLILVFTREENHLSLEVDPWWQEPYRLTLLPLSDSTFADDVQETRVTFHRDANGKVEQVRWADGTVYRRVPPYEPSEEDLAAFAGEFYSEELEVVYTLCVENRRLRLSIPGPDSVNLRPWEPDIFLAAFPLEELRFERDDEGEITGFVAGGGVVFEKLG